MYKNRDIYTAGEFDVSDSKSFYFISFPQLFVIWVGIAVKVF